MRNRNLIEGDFTVGGMNTSVKERKGGASFLGSIGSLFDSKYFDINVEVDITNLSSIGKFSFNPQLDAKENNKKFKSKIIITEQEMDTAVDEKNIHIFR